MKKLIGLFTTALLLGNLSVNASTITGSDLVSNAATASAEVTFSKAASVTITIPERCRLNSGTKTGTYQICVAGEIQPNIRYTVAPRDQSETAPGINFVMKNETNAVTKKADILGTITQDGTTWTPAEVKAATVRQGTISVLDATAGTWQGNVTFDVIPEKLYKAFDLKDGLNAVVKKTTDGHGTVHIVAEDTITELSETALADALAALDTEFASLTITDIYVSWSDQAVSNQDVYWGLQSMNPVLHFDTASIF